MKQQYANISIEVVTLLNTSQGIPCKAQGMLIGTQLRNSANLPIFLPPFIMSYPINTSYPQLIFFP